MPSGNFVTVRFPLAWVVLAALWAPAVAGCGSSATTNLVSAATTKCQLTASASARSFPSGGGSGSVTVTTDRECGWTVTTDSSWVSLGSPASGQGNATVNFNVSANPAAAGRSGQLRVNDLQIQISEDAAPCRYAIDPGSGSFGPQGGDGSVNVTSLPGCAWSSSSGAPWLSVQGSGSGNGRASFTVGANSGAQRTGTLTIAGIGFAVTQAGAPTPAPTPDPPPTPTPPQPPTPAPCQYAVSPSSESLTAAGGSFVVTVKTGDACSWTATSSADWLTITSGASGTGNGSVGATAAADLTTTDRTATLTVAGQAVTVTQRGLPVVQLNGTVSQKSGSCPSITFVVSGTTVGANGATTYASGSCGDVVNDARVKVGGIQNLDGTVTATDVQIQKKAH